MKGGVAAGFLARGARRSPRSVLAIAVSGAVLAVLAPAVPASAAGPCDPPVLSVIACENSLPGSPSSQWDVVGSGSSTIQGFTTDISYAPGASAVFKVKTPSSNYRLDIYRMGYYGGDGARKVATVQPSVALPQTQPGCKYVSSTGLRDCGNWKVSAIWSIPSNAVSGIYFAKLVREDGTSGASHVVFVVRNDTSGSALLFQTSDTTWQAYNRYGGNSLYVGKPAGRAYKVSYNRPLTTRGTTPQDSVFNAEYPMVRFLEANGYDVSYTSGIDTDRRGAELLEHQVFMSVGHDEYWSAGQRANVEAARDAGVHLAFFSGNEMFWKTRWESSVTTPTTSYRTLVSYKESKANAKIDPNPAWTGTWRDARFSPPSDGGRPENALTGTLFMVNGPRSDAIAVPADDGRMRLWRDTSVATLAPGEVATFAAGTLGYEWDEDVDNGARPPGIVRMSTASYSVPGKLLDTCCTFGSGVATHHLTLYRHPSGALVFGAGTVQWSWGLDSSHDLGSAPADVRMQQATVNLFADMGVQPATLLPTLTPATASTDVVAPSATVTAPAEGATVPLGEPVTISGTATDTGGVVGGVDVSVDGGATWHPATGREAWSYTWTPTTTGPATIMARPVDDSANLGAASTGVNVEVVSTPSSCPCSIWADTATPGTASSIDTSAVEIGVKFRSDVAGSITGVRFYKGSANTGTHVGSLWSATGTLLAQATFTDETASGWQQVSFSAPVAIAADTTYIASYHTNVGGYAEDKDFFVSTGVDTPPLHALQTGVDGYNGVYAYGADPTFPANGSLRSRNYWVDVVFQD
ncbi:MAG: N,N-dimethylformamidase beta subunit family domain-containing protein [Microthrixaceae bacterium]